jgi:hypothetical protein
MHELSSKRPTLRSDRGLVLPDAEPHDRMPLDAAEPRNGV